MTSPAAINHVRGIHVLNDGGVRTGLPFFECWLMRAGMTAAANLCRNLQARPRRRVVRIGGVVARWSMAIFALNAFELRSGGGVGEPRGHAVANRMASQAAWVRVLMNLLQSRKCLGMQSVHHGIVNRLVTFDAGLRPHETRSWTKDPKQSI